MALPPRPTQRWIDPEPVDDATLRALRSALELPRPVCRLLARRGHGDPDAARRFLRPSFAHLHPAALLPDLEPAVQRLAEAVRGRETVLVHGDYDADGVCAAALLARGLSELGARVVPFVPHRIRDGYDLGEAGLRRARDANAGLILTADCGISAVAAVEAAAEEGRDVVITDHHRPPERLPPARALVAPTLDDSRYPFDGLSGVGVAFKLLSALWEARGRDRAALNRHLDLVALGTVADVVPLVGENRVLVRAGLRALERSRKPGIGALKEAAGLEGELTAGGVGWVLAPRLNSAGRVGDADSALRLLLTSDPAEAADLADTLERHNRERREEDRRVQEAAERRLERDYDPERDRAVVVWGDDWHPGVVGIAASRIMERVHRPTVLVTFRGGTGRGSGRSVAGFHLREALSRCAPLLERFGGHRKAAGFEIRRENVDAFADRLRELARSELAPDDLEPTLELDLSVPLAEADDELLGWMRHFAPFGAGNPRPVLASRGVRFRDASAVGKEGRHLKATLEGDGGARLDAIAFGRADLLERVGKGGRWDVAYELKEDRWRGRRRLQARLRGVRPAS